MLAFFAGGVIDGLDGLAGGVFGSIIAAYAGIAFFQQQINLAAFLAVMGGALLAFLWYNVPPARFYMGETVEGVDIHVDGGYATVEVKTEHGSKTSSPIQLMKVIDETGTERQLMSTIAQQSKQ